MQDLISQGIDEGTALSKAKESITSIESMVEGNRLIYIDKFKTECLQTSLIYLIIAWILTIPPIILNGFSLLNGLLFFAVMITTIIYFIKKATTSETIGFIDIAIYQRRKKLVWIIWSIFYVIYALFLSAIFFGSNIWFGRPVHINGPYAFYNIAIRYYTPLITILIPICISSFPKLIYKYETRDGK